MWLIFIHQTKREFYGMKKDISPQCDIVENGSGGIEF